MARQHRFRSIRPLYRNVVPSEQQGIDPFRVLSILKLTRGPVEKADLVVMLDTSLADVETAVMTLAGKGIIRVDPGDKPEKDIVAL